MAVRIVEVHTNSANLKLRVAPGHFATSHSHINYYVDLTMAKHRLSESREAASHLCAKLSPNTIVDTILCLDGTEVIGACMASQLTDRAGFSNINAHKTIYVLTPEHTTGSQLIFRENSAPMVVGKHVLILAASVTTGYTIDGAMQAIRYYGGNVAGVCAVFSCLKAWQGHEVYSVFNKEIDLPNYTSKTPLECPMCKAGKKLDAMVNAFGVSSFNT